MRNHIQSFGKNLLGNAVIVLLAAAAGYAAETTGTVRGEVVDQSGAKIPATNIELVNTATALTYRQQSGEEGQFVFNLVPPGSYSIRASREGFRTYTVTGVLVEVNKTTQVNLKMDLGQVTETIEVSASAAVIDTASAKISTNVDRRFIIELPSSTRNALAAALLAPGVDLSNTGSQVMGGLGTGANVNGLRRSANVFYLDGSDNTGSWRHTGNQFPNPEAVAEVQVSTANVSAEFGRQPGGVFNVVTKSGTNEFHGAGFYFFRNENLNANQWARNLTGSARPEDNVRQGGGTLGGPVRKDRTFFFTSLMFYRDKTPGFQNTVQFPTKAMQAGDFSQFTRPLHDPDGGAPLPGNLIPRNRLDPVAARLSALIPTVERLGDRFVWAFVNPLANHEMLVKLDENLSGAHRLQASFYRTWGGQQTNPGGNNVPAWHPVATNSRQYTASVTHIWVPRPTVLVESRFAFARHGVETVHTSIGQTLEDFGAKWPRNAETSKKCCLPALQVSDGFAAGVGGGSQYFAQPNYNFASTVSRISGRHNLKIGVNFQRTNVRQYKDNDAASFQFDGRASSRPASGASQGVGVFGYAAADFLMGRASTFSAQGIRDYDIRSWTYSFFVQDDWRLNRHFTVNAGLRYEIFASARETQNRLSQFLLGHRSSQYPKAPPNLAFAGDDGVPAGFYKTPLNNLGPRLGLAYDPVGDGKTALRAAAGYYFSGFTIQQKMYSAEGTPWNPGASGGDTLNLLDPWGTSRAVRYDRPPLPFSTDISTFNFPPRITNLYHYDPGIRTPYVLQWNFSIERQVLPAIKFWAAYVGNRSFKFVQVLQPNLPVWRPDASLQNIEARRPVAGYGAISGLHARSRGWYDAFQFSADARLGRGFVSRFVYTFAENQSYAAEDLGTVSPSGFTGTIVANPLNANGEKGPTGPRHVGRFFYVYDLPLGRGASGLAARLLGNWQISGSFSAASGGPINVELGSDWNFDGVPRDRPDLVGPIRYTSGSRDTRMQGWFDKSSFAAPAVRNVFGTLPRNALRGPGNWSSDFSLAKRFQLSDSRYLQVRGEAYNVTNHNNLANPNTTMSSVDFTRITTRSGNRTVQIGLRFVF